MAATLNERVHFGLGAIREVEAMLDALGARSVLLVTGKTSFRSSGADAALRRALDGRRTTTFSDVVPNPGDDLVDRGVALLRRCEPDVILAVGGGSALDTAKLIALVAGEDCGAAELVASGKSPRGATVPIIAVPTTAGSGSEVTPFAVLSIAGRKHSIAHPSILPRYAVVDPELTFNLPPLITAATGWDALAQAIEGIWCVNSTAESAALAPQAIRLLLPSVVDAATNPTPQLRAAMAEGALLAGKAIAITRTTVPHAMSYPITMRFGVPHGHAVALTLGASLEFNAAVRDDDAADKRGAAFVRTVLDELIRLLGATSAADARALLCERLAASGLATTLAGVGVRTRADRNLIASEVNPERLGNNPRRMQHADIVALIESVAG